MNPARKSVLVYEHGSGSILTRSMYRCRMQQYTPALHAHFLATQHELLRQRKEQPLPKHITSIAGCDSALMGDHILSVIVVCSFPNLEQQEVVTATAPITIPYIPGMLSFRELPTLVAAYRQLQHSPDVLMVDGHGSLHPRRMGIAMHLGIVLDVPTVGVAKKRLVGTVTSFEATVGNAAAVIHQGETIGIAYQSKDRTRPIFISPGQYCDLDSACWLVEKTLRGYKLPEPTRIADALSKRLKTTA